MKYTIISQKSGCHLLVESMLKSVEKHLTPDEILIYHNGFVESKKCERHGLIMNKQIMEAKNEYILILDHDILVLDGSLIEEMLTEISKPNVYACGTHDYVFDGKLTLVPCCIMLNKNMFLSNGIRFDGGGNPCWAAFNNARKKGQNLIKIDAGKRLFHLGRGNKVHYSKLIVNKYWRTEFEKWKTISGSNANFDDYVKDDGMDIEDLHQLNNLVLQQLDYAIANKLPFSTMRLGDLGLRYLDGYFFSPEDFTHVGLRHPDLAMPSDEIGKTLIKELIENMKNAKWIDHPELYKGAFGDLYKWRFVLGRCSEIYEKAGINTPNTNYCSSLQSYMSFVKDFEWTLYDIMKGRKIMFVGPSDSLGILNTRKNIQAEKYGYYQLSMSSDYWERYRIMEKFFNDFNPNDWDLVLVTGSLYGRTIIGRVAKMGGRAFDVGQSIHFNLNHIFATVLESIENKTYYKIKDWYNYEHRRVKSNIS